MLNEKQIISNILKNIAYYEYDVLDEKISIVSRGNTLIISQKIEDIFETKDFVVASESRGDILNFFNLVKYDSSKNQIAIKINNNNIDKWYLLSSFPRDKDTNVVRGMIENVSSFMIEQDKLKELAKTDSLTGLLNRYHIEKYINECIVQKKFFYFCMLDLDYFKNINDTYGHVYGDKVLKQVASALKKVVGKDGALGRIGGDEFIIVKKLNEAPSLDEKREFCRAIRNEFRNKENDAIVYSNLTTTLGLVTYPFDGMTYKDLAGNVDKALYKGKAKGRNCYIIFNEQIHGHIDTSKPYEDVFVNDLVQTADPAIFISDVLTSLLQKSTIEKINEKIEQITFYFKINKVSVYKHENDTLRLVYKYVIDKDLGDIEVTDIKDFFRQFDNLLFNASDVYEYKHDRYESSKCMKIPYESGSLLMTACGIKHDMDYIMAFETYEKRRIWNYNFLVALKILSKMIMTFYLKG